MFARHRREKRIGGHSGGYGTASGADALELTVVMVAYPRECTEYHWRVYFKMMSFMFCELYFNKTVVKIRKYRIYRLLSPFKKKRFYFKIISTSNVRLEFTIWGSRAGCSTDKPARCPLQLNFYIELWHLLGENDQTDCFLLVCLLRLSYNNIE